MSKRSKWMKGLPGGLIDAILKEEPDKVEFDIVEPSSVTCTITCSNEKARGIAICSVEDKKLFNVVRGKRKSARRALKALKNKTDLLPIRVDKSQFSRKWKPSQINRVIDYGLAFGNKAIYQNVR